MSFVNYPDSHNRWLPHHVCQCLLHVPDSSMSDDWDKVTVLRKKAPKAAQMRSESAVNQAIRTGQAVETQQKCE